MVQQMNTSLKNCTSTSGPLDSSTAPFVGSWKCNVCGEKFSDPKAHVDHMGSHTQDYPSSCQLCLSRFKNGVELSEHICAANTRNKSRTQVAITAISTTSVKPILQNGEPKPPILKDETQIVNNAGHSHSIPLPAIYDDDYELGVALRRSRSSSMETNNNQSELGKSEFFVVDPWLACSTLITTPDMMEMESFTSEAAINEAVGDMLAETLINSQSIKNITLRRKKHGKNQRNASLDAGIGRDRKLSTGSGQNSVHSTPGSHIVDCPRLSLSVPLNNVANNEEMIFDEPDLQPQPIPSRYQYSSRELKCVLCNVIFTRFEDWKVHAFEKHIKIDDPNYPMVHMNYVNLAEIGGSDGPFVVSTDENGKLLIVPKPAPKLEPVIERAVEKKPNVAEEGREALKFTLCRSEGRSYVVKRKSTDSTDTNESSSTDKQPVMETTPPRAVEERNDSESGVLSTAESPCPTASPERDEEFDKILEAVVEQSRIKPVNQTPTAPPPPPPPKDIGESNKVTATTTSRMGFRPRFMRVMQNHKKGSIKQKIQVVGSREPVTRSQTNDETRPAVSSGPDKPSVTSTPSVISDQPLVSQEERLTNSVTDENDNHSKTANSKSPVPSESTGTPPALTDKELPKEQSSSPKISAVSDLRSNNNNVDATNKDLAKPISEASREAPSETSQISPSQPQTPVSNEVENSNKSKESVSGEQQAIITESTAVVNDAEDEDDDDGALMIDVPGESGPTAKKPRANNDDDSSVKTATQDLEKSKVNEDNVTVAEVSAPESEKGASTSSNDNDKNNPDEEKPEEEEQDLQCRVCKQMFTCDEDLETHFSAEHFRPVGSSILEPESPFPTVTVHGNSSIFEDEVEESEPINLEPVAQNTLQSLLRRSSTEEQQIPAVTIAPLRHPGPVQNRMVMPFGPHIRPNMHGRGVVPNTRPQLQMVPPGNTAAQNRPAMRPPPNMAPGPGPRGPVPYRANSFPYTLHQALANPQHGPVQGPPQRPQLRPMPGAHMQGGPRAQGPQTQNRPPLTRVAPTTQMGPGQQQNAVVTQQQAALMSPPISTQHRELSMQILQFQQKLQQVVQSIQNITQAMAQEVNSQRHSHLQIEKDQLSNLLFRYRQQLRSAQQQQQDIERQHHNQIQQQRQHQQNQIQQQQHQQNQIQQQQHQQNQIQQHQQNQIQQQQQQQQRHHQLQQQQLQRQQLQQMQLQQQQEQEIRNQQQLQQQRQQQINEARNSSMNSNGKRPAIEVFDVTHANRVKQPRIDFGQPEETTITEVNPPTNKNPPVDNRTLRIPNGLSLSIVQHSDRASPPTQVAPGAHSGSSTSTGSRHSSRTTSPAIASPGTATKLINNGVTVTPASPISPPPNPILSPISDCSPRSSPKTPVNSVIQRVSNSVSPAASAGSGSPSPGVNNGLQQNVNFAIPRAPIPARAPNNANVGYNPIAERPDRPPTIDLTDDDIQMHNAQMRATGGGAVTEEQIQNHEAYQRRVAGIPGTSQFSIRQPSTTANQLKSVSCPHCNVFFGSVESMNEHKLRAHGHGPLQIAGPNVPQQFRQPTGPQLAIRRQSPQPASLLNSNMLRAGDMPIRAPPRLPPPHQLMLRGQNPPQPRAQDVVAQRPRSSGGEAERFVIPLLNISRLEPAKLRALNELGVMSLIPLQGITRLGIPIMRLRPDVSLGHFPHDSALEIGPIQMLESALGGGPSLTTSTSPNSGSPGSSRPPAGSPNNINMNTGVCTDASCPEYHHQVQRPTGNPINVHVNGPVAHSNNVVAIPSNNQYHQNIRDPIVGNHGQLIVTPINRQ